MTTEFLPAFLIGYSNSDFTNPHEVVLPDGAPDCRLQFTHMGAKYSGFETVRHRATRFADGGFDYDHDAHHWLHIGLHQRSQIESIKISTKWFTGNQVRAVSVYLIDELSGTRQLVLERVPLNPDAEHEFPLGNLPASECLVECYYEGGIARVQLFGQPASELLPERPNLLEGARISHVSNDHYGNPAMAVAGLRKENHMVGWESARTGFGERALFHLAQASVVREIVVDTYLHRLNPPLSCHVFGLNEKDENKIEALMGRAPRWKLSLGDGREIIPENFQAYMLAQGYLEQGVKKFRIALDVPDPAWIPILPWAELAADRYHRFRQLESAGPITHLLYMHYPNGGIHGLKALGGS
ncbi:hypothetical protein JST97_06295 [bacterium]|nr:hypothetical protein [bacterium]